MNTEPRSTSMRPLALPAVLRVAGVSFHPASRRVRVGEALTVRPEPDNPFDPCACVFLHQDEPVGHVPQALSARLRATGHSSWTAEVVEVLQGGQHPGLRVRVCPGTTSSEDHPTAIDRSLTAPPAVPPADRKTTPVPRIEVRARSGRLLGTLLIAVDNSVEVLTEDGLRVRYPSALVDVAPA